MQERKNNRSMKERKTNRKKKNERKNKWEKRKKACKKIQMAGNEKHNGTKR